MYYVLMDIAEGCAPLLIGVYTDRSAAEERQEEYILNEVEKIFNEDSRETGLEDTLYERSRIYKEIAEEVVILAANKLGGV
jgi:hypothetical protein